MSRTVELPEDVYAALHEAAKASGMTPADWIAAHLPEAPVNVMDQYHPDNFCDPASAKYRPQYAEIARRPKASEIQGAYRHAERLGLHYETVTFERSDPERYASIPEI
jgi:putative pyruvate formate lyase activating enzyme